MTVSLISHNNKYHLDCSDTLLSLSTGLSAIPYAIRHWELSKNKEISFGQKLAHRLLACIQALPGGILFGVIERIIVLAHSILFPTPPTPSVPSSIPPTPQAILPSPSSISPSASSSSRINLNIPEGERKELTSSASPPLTDLASAQLNLNGRIVPCYRGELCQTTRIEWGANHPLSPEAAFDEMYQESVWALNYPPEAVKKIHACNLSDVVATEAQGLPDREALRKAYLEKTALAQPLEFRHVVKSQEKLGQDKPRMQDTQLYQENDQGILQAVFDGHGRDGHIISESLKKEFATEFERKMKDHNQDVFRSFEATIEHLDQPEHDSGSTAAIVRIDRLSGLIYTANVGDSGASLYRQVDGELREIPLSRPCSWKREAYCTKHIRQDKAEVDWLRWLPSFFDKNSPKETVRVYGLLTSRSIGHHINKNLPLTCPLRLTAQPTITINRVQPGDIIVVGSDGLLDHSSRQARLEAIAKSGSDPVTIADALMGCVTLEDDTTISVSVVS